MKYKIYQIKDTHKCPYSFLPWKWIGGKFNFNDYELKYEGDVTLDSPVNRQIFDGEYLEKLFYILNCEIPNDYKGHSLSVSDIVELENGNKYYCDSAGWEKLN